MLTTPIAIDAKRLFVVSYFAPAGGQIALGQVASERGPLMTSSSPAFGWPTNANKERPVNVYRLAGPGFPDTSAGDNAFWVDVVFVPDMAAE
jgi:hypothetical protein